MSGGAGARGLQRMFRYLLHHQHGRRSAASCSPPSRGSESALRHQQTLASCAFGGHAIWWVVEAASEEDALALLPFYVAERATATRVSPVEIP